MPGRKVMLYECVRCRIAWQWPVDRHSSVDLMRDCHERADGFWSGDEITARTRRQAAFVAQLSAPGRLLDVGGADGAFAVAAASHGWDCTVIDPAFSDRRLSDRARIINGLLSDLPAEPEFDVATMWAMIEHVPDYPLLIREAYLRLKPGGSLIIEALNYQSLQRVRDGGSWWGFQVDHLWYLSPREYQALASEIGFSRCRLERTVLRDHWRGEQSQIRSSVSYAKEAVKRPWRLPAAIAAALADSEAARRWPEWCTLPIQTLVATK
jgi:SAM-dependent methyltransferase